MTSVTDPTFADRLLRPASWLALLVWAAVFGVLLGPTVNEDSVFGLLAARASHEGAPWNHLLFPRPEALTATASAFLAWWPPGQWIFPDLLGRLGLPLGWALTLTSITAMAGGLLGWARLYRRLGYDELTVALSLGFVVLSINFWRRLAEYHGGEALLFGALPWIALGGLRIGLTRRSLVLLPLLFFAGAFLKLSFSIAALALVLTLWARDHARTPFTAASLRSAAIAGAAFAIFYVLFFWLYLSRGATPNTAFGEHKWSQLPLMAAGPLSFLVGGQSLAGRFFPAIGDYPEIFAALVVAAVALWLTVVAARAAPGPAARFAVASFCSVNVAAIGFLYWRGNQVWFLDRIFLPGGMFLLPALIALARLRGGFTRGFTVLLLGAATIYSCAHAFQYGRWLRAATALSPQHVRHLGVDAAGLAEWKKLGDSPPPGAVAFYSDPGAASLALEWPRWRAYVPAYSALYGRLDGGPAHFEGRPAALRLVGFTDSEPFYAVGGLAARFPGEPAAEWRAVTLGRLVVWEARRVSAP